MGLQHFIYTKTHFCTTGHIRFLHVCGTQGVQSVDQNIRSFKGRSQLSVAIFMASRNHLVALKSSIYKKTSLFGQRFPFRQGQPDFWPHIYTGGQAVPPKGQPNIDVRIIFHIYV